MASETALGVLTTQADGGTFRYQFTPPDALWLARFIVGEAGGRDDADNRAVIWAMFNRYALFTRRAYPTFHQFIRAYSTTLQPVLNSAGAAKRHRDNPNFVRTGGVYPGTDIPKGQLRQFLELQRRPWTDLPQAARQLAWSALKGDVANPIGNASEFASTRVYFHDKYKRWPTPDEWRTFTITFAASHTPGGKRPWTWIGDVAGLNQSKNAFFVDERASALPANAIRVSPSAVQGELAPSIGVAAEQEFSRGGGRMRFARSGRRPARLRRPSRRRDPRSLGPGFWEGYRRRRHPRFRRPGFDGYVAQVDGLPLLYRRALLGSGVVVDEPEPPAVLPPSPSNGADAEPAAPPAAADATTDADAATDGADAGTPDGADASGNAAAELEQITRSYRARLRWSDAVPLPSVQKLSGGGLYIVEKRGKPIYVGQADGFARRWVVRLEVLRQLAVSTAPYTIRVAHITGADSPLTGAPGARLRIAIEHTLVRGLLLQKYALTNASSIRPFTVGTIALTHEGARPSYIVSAPVPGPGSTYEAWPPS